MKKSLFSLILLCFACFGVAKAQTELMTENFDGMSSIATSYSATGWFAYNAGNGNNWTINTSSTYAHSGSNSAQVQYNSSYAANCYLVSAPFTTSPNMTEISVSLYERSRSSYYAETFEVFFVKASDVTTAASVTSATQYNAISSQDYTNETYAEVTGSYTSSALAGQDLRVVVHCTSIADRYYLNIDDITVSDNGVISCPKPANLEVTNDGATATATWEGDATDYNISINGNVINNVTSPYTFEVETSTTYTVMVEANCTGETSGYCNPVTFTVQCLPQDMCSITLALTDSYNDGWNGGKMEVVDANTSEVYGTYTIASGGSETYELALCPGTVVNFVYTAGSYGTENGWVIYDAGGEVITEEAGCNSGCTHTNGVQATYTMNCSGCFKPKNLTETNVSFTSATLSWEGNNDSYVLQYRPWNPAGDDIITTGEMVTYTVDLSQYEGTGSVAIRHYDISDMFQLIVDNIEVTNAGGTVVYSQDFEDCGGNMPAEFSNMDLDGDGFTWQIASSPSSNVDGSYGIVSESYNNDYGALTPDNWLILSGLEMGGQMTFQARGQDPDYAAENFAIYVSTENSIVEVPVTATTYNATGLTPNTPYAWQVKGICGDEETSYVSSFFKTKDDMFVFATTGNWNVVSNWKDAEGNAVTALPTADNNVRIDADVTIPAGYVAYANKATIGTGSITIEDGGQLKQNAASLRVTMEKEIAGYGESDGYYYFIASPFNGRTLYSTSGSFSHVDNMLTGEYDLYAFDATASDGLEWINYKHEPTHIAFQAENGLAGLLYGEGYLYANQDGTTIEFEGTAGKSNNYSETKDYTFDSESTDDFNGWALVGNFFTCNAYINYIDANGNMLDADFYTLNLDNTYSLMSSNQPLPPCTGALINYSATGKVQYSTEPTNSKGSMLNMTVSEGRGTVDQVRVRFGQGHNLKHMSFRNNSKLYMPVEGNDYAVVYAENEGEMPVSFKAEKNGNYTISFSNENVEFGYLHLIDNMTGADIDLLETPSYSFDAKVTDYASRFKLVFAAGSNNNDSFAFYNNGNIVINNEGSAILNIVDVLGRTISSQTINGSENVSINAKAGVYTLQLIQGENVKTQKIVVE